jgi:hypothetical protein
MVDTAYVLHDGGRTFDLFPPSLAPLFVEDDAIWADHGVLLLAHADPADGG